MKPFYCSIFFVTSLAVLNTCYIGRCQEATDHSDFIEATLPAVVRIDTPLGNGTGFFISDDGWIITNHHVIKNAPIDPDTGYQMCRLSLAKLNEKAEVEVVGDNVWGTVYKVNKRSDLALIRADELPSGMTRTPFFKLAEKQGKLGEDCFTIGMPKRGVNWAVRKGVVSGHGLYPDDVSGSEQPKKVADGSYRVTITTCGINPGDSGGPLFNASKEIIAVNKAIPLIEDQVNLDKFTYHINLTELIDFIKEFPETPEITPPASKQEYLRCQQIINKEANFKLVNLNDPRSELVVFMLDIDSKGPTLEDKQLELALNMPEQEFWKRMSIDWAFVKSRHAPISYFFDLDQDGMFEQVYVAAIDDGSSATQYTYKDKKWIFSKAADDFLDRVQFDSVDLKNAFEGTRKLFNVKIKR